ncbi:phospholipase A and acyltransferase 1 [Manacus vitellinus]|uniref:phospholipase A and acyltransferase 1 n=1 Tax=Manacus vitellinus TaxID=328815 RepID=UPI0008470FFD|nr:phospholipase A and acyltransferase 1 [Manacus vitellinus]XP_051637230.1 phospholipase A and acyltransferase 1-like [Manacus candei]XP_051637231.1 phospholipase A and acyltransferase 1-like [Manacus candei]
MSRRRHQPEPGDLIKIKRSVYQHWALYLGDGYVVHLTSADEGIRCLSASSDTTLSKKAKVKKQLLKEVVGNNDWEVNNKYDRSRTPLPVKEIIKRAESYIDREMSYDVLCENCEHFVTMLRYGKSVSDQARIGFGSILSFGAVVCAGIAVACAAFVSPRDKSREKK